jgi:DDE superfamily endonuclease
MKHRRPFSCRRRSRPATDRDRGRGQRRVRATRSTLRFRISPTKKLRAGALRSPLVRARRQSRHLDDEPLLSPDRRHGQKKTLVACEQDRPDIGRHRKRWRTYQGLIDPRRLVFIDETWTKTNMTRLRGWAPRGERLVDKVPQGKWKTATFLAALCNDRIDAPCLFDGPSTASASTAMSNSSSCRR